MAQKTLYVLLNSATNQVDTQGVGLWYLTEAMKQPLKNILILSGPDGLGEYDEYTRFRLVRGRTAVRSFIQRAARGGLEAEAKWADYQSLELIHQLSPGEIAELLYLAHMDHHWRSPFFYKLQNNYVCLGHTGPTSRLYYRRIQEFFYQLARRIQELLTEAAKERLSLFSFHLRRHPDAVTLPSLEVIERMRPLLYEGVLFDFAYEQRHNALYIPLFLAEDHAEETVRELERAERIGELVYDTTSEKWHVETSYAARDNRG